MGRTRNAKLQDTSSSQAASQSADSDTELPCIDSDMREAVSSLINSAMDKLRGDLNELVVNKLAYLKRELTEFYKPIVDDLKKQMIEVKTEIAALKSSASRAPTVSPIVPQPTTEPTFRMSDVKRSKSSLAVVHLELADKARRVKNIIIRGLPASETVTDAMVFRQLCEDHLSIKPHFRDENCKRLGGVVPGRVRPLLVTFETETVAKELIACAPLLRQATDPLVKASVFINRDLTQAEALAAYEIRQQRRQRHTTAAAAASGSTSRRDVAGSDGSQGHSGVIAVDSHPIITEQAGILANPGTVRTQMSATAPVFETTQNSKVAQHLGARHKVPSSSSDPSVGPSAILAAPSTSPSTYPSTSLTAAPQCSGQKAPGQSSSTT